MWPKLEGRFPQVSGINFAFDPSKPPGSRVDQEFVKIGDEYLDLEQHYKLVTKAYLALGKDGYEALSQGNILVDDECSPTLTLAVQNHFKAIQQRQVKGRRSSIHHQSLVMMSRKTSVVKHLTEEGLIPPSRVSPRSISPSKSPGRVAKLAQQPSVEDLEEAACQLEPKGEGRILQLTPEVAKRIKLEKEKNIKRLTIAEVEEKSSPEDEVRTALFSVPGKAHTGVTTKNQDSVSADLK